MKLSAGTLLQGGKYRIDEHLGSGGFGCTYKAYYNTMCCYVAIKEFFVKDFCNREEDGTVKVATQGKEELVEKLRNKFFNEARTLFSSKMYHPNIVRVSDVFEENGTVYYVMDYIEGSTLATLIEQKGHLPEDEALCYIRQVADALKHLHANNCLHLDVKPANIMVDSSGKAVLIDFGVSKQYDEAKGENTSTLLGHTPGYAPIEQSGRGLIKFNAACDIYALGATLYKALTGTTPVEATLRAGDKSLCELTYPEHVSVAIRAAIDKAMQISRGDRPQSIAEFLCLVESGKMQDENDGETELNGNVKAVDFDGTSSERSHVAQTAFVPRGSRLASVVKGENGKPVADESQSIDVVEVPDSADTVISNEGEKSHSAGAVISNDSEKSQKNKPGKSLWLILLLLLLIAVAGAWFLFSGTGNGDAPKESERLAAERRKNALVRDENELLCVACVDKNDKSILYFTGDEWKELPEDEKSNYPQLGVSIREDDHEFIIAASDCKGEYEFGGNGIDFEDVKNYKSFDDVDAAFITTGRNDTKKIVEQTKGEIDFQGISGAPAAEAAWKYKANGHDPLLWYLPSHSELQMIYRHKNDINRFLEDYFPSSTSISGGWYWSSTELDYEWSWYVYMYNGGSYTGNRTHSHRVRAVASAK